MTDQDSAIRYLVQQAYAQEPCPELDVAAGLSDVLNRVRRPARQLSVADSYPNSRQGLATLKLELPAPFNQDLSLILCLLSGNTLGEQEELANDPVTASYLAAGMRLIERNLGPGGARTPVDLEGDIPVQRPLLSFLSERAVVAEVANNAYPFSRAGNVATLRSIWRSQSDFIADLLRFGLWAAHYPAAHQHEVTAAAEQAIIGVDFVAAIHTICYWDLLVYLGMPMFRLQLVAAASSEDDEAIQRAISERYSETIGLWKELYASFLDVRGLRLREGITLDECADLLTAVAEGLALRQLADPNAKFFDHERRSSLLGKATLAVIKGCLESAEASDGLTLEQAVHDMIHDHRRAT